MGILKLSYEISKEVQNKNFMTTCEDLDSSDLNLNERKIS